MDKDFDTAINNIMYNIADNMRDKDGRPYFTYKTKMKIRFRVDDGKSYNIITNLSEWCWLFYQGVENLMNLHDNPPNFITNFYYTMGLLFPYYKKLILYSTTNDECTLNFENNFFNLEDMNVIDERLFDRTFTANIIDRLSNNSFYCMEIGQYSVDEKGKDYAHRNTLFIQRINNDYYFTIYEPHGSYFHDGRHYSCGSLLIDELEQSLRRLGKNPVKMIRETSCANIGIQAEISEGMIIKAGGYCIMYNYLFLYVLFTLVRDNIIDNIPMNIWFKRLDITMVNYMNNFNKTEEKVNYILGFTYMLIQQFLQLTSFNIRPDLSQKINNIEEKYGNIFNERRDTINNANLTKRQKYDLIIKERELYNKRVNKLKEPIVKEAEMINMDLDRILLNIFRQNRSPTEEELDMIKNGSFSSMVKLKIITDLLNKKDTSFYIDEESIKVPKTCIIDQDCPSSLSCINKKCLTDKVLEEECEDQDQCIEGSCVWIKDLKKNICKDNDLVERKGMRFWPGSYISYFGSFLPALN